MKELFSNYVKEKQLLDKDFIEKYINKYKWENSLDDEIQSIWVNNVSAEDAAYIYEYRMILFNLNKIYKQKVEELNINEVTYENVLKLNMIMLTIINHELTHAKQYSTIDHSLNFLLKTILSDSLYHAIYNYENYLLKHDDYIHEYNANINSQIETFNFLDDKHLSLLYSPIIKHYLNDYLNGQVPIERFYKMANIELPDFKNLRGYDYMSDFDKLLYGLPIKNETVEKIKIMEQVDNYKNYFERR